MGQFFSDADFAGDKESRKSTSGCIIDFASGPVVWFSRRQPVVALSTTEAEYIAASAVAREVIWVRRLLNEIQHQCVEPTVLYVDNRSTIQLCKYPSSVRSTKHIETRFHFIREKVESNELQVEHIAGEDQLADICTKILPKTRFCKLRDAIGLKWNI